MGTSSSKAKRSVHPYNEENEPQEKYALEIQQSQQPPQQSLIQQQQPIPNNKLLVTNANGVPSPVPAPPKEAPIMTIIDDGNSDEEIHKPKKVIISPERVCEDTIVNDPTIVGTVDKVEDVYKKDDENLSKEVDEVKNSPQKEVIALVGDKVNISKPIQELNDISPIKDNEVENVVNVPMLTEKEMNSNETNENQITSRTKSNETNEITIKEPTKLENGEEKGNDDDEGKEVEDDENKKDDESPKKDDDESTDKFKKTTETNSTIESNLTKTSSFVSKYVNTWDLDSDEDKNEISKSNNIVVVKTTPSKLITSSPTSSFSAEKQGEVRIQQQNNNNSNNIPKNNIDFDDDDDWDMPQTPSFLIKHSCHSPPILQNGTTSNVVKDNLQKTNSNENKKSIDFDDDDDDDDDDKIDDDIKNQNTLEESEESFQFEDDEMISQSQEKLNMNQNQIQKSQSDNNIDKKKEEELKEEIFVDGIIRPDDEWSKFGSGKLAIGGQDDDGKLSQLSCISCGFEVLRFRSCVWSKKTDYMHFRNYNGHSLNLKKLCSKLCKNETSAAYACQCSWQSLNFRKEISPLGTSPGSEGGAANGLICWKLKKKNTS